MNKGDATLLLASVDFNALGDVFQSAIAVPQAVTKARRTPSDDEQVFFESMQNSMTSRGASKKLALSQTRKVRPQIRKNVLMKTREHNRKKLSMPLDRYLERYVYSFWAREGGFAEEYRQARQAYRRSRQNRQ